MAERALAAAPQVADVCVLVEGTYPFVSGGVSSWVHDIIRGHPNLSFAVLNVGSYPGSTGDPRYELPSNVIALHRVFCQEASPVPLDSTERAVLAEQIRELRRTLDTRDTRSRTLAALRRLHVDEAVGGDVLADLAANDLALPALLHGRESFELLTAIAERLAPDAPFLDLFWHFRAIHVPVLRLLAAPVVPARCYHAVATGYAGMLAAVWSHRTGRPLVVTEHGIYAREREMELARADWIRDNRGAPLRRLWSRFFRVLAGLAYQQARRLVTLSEVNRRKQLADGAPAQKISVVPNGVDLRPDAPAAAADAEGIIPLPVPRPLRVGFVGRVVPIKDVITFVKACDLALRVVDLDVRIIGPVEEDPGYVARCRNLVELLGREQQIKFLGPMPPARIYPDLDVVVLTSFSEGQPLVILEGYACALPVVATDVGACREMVEGRTEADRALGPSGIVTRVAMAKETASALVTLAKDPALRRRMGSAGRKRVTAYYQKRDMLAAYAALYAEMVA